MYIKKKRGADEGRRIEKNKREITASAIVILSDQIGK